MNYKAIIERQITELQDQPKNTAEESCLIANTIIALVEAARHLPLTKNEPEQK